ncbi:MAG: hypothetical protein V7709_02575 [Halioglobus sp.]
MDRVPNKVPIISHALSIIGYGPKKHSTPAARKTVEKVMRQMNRQEVPEEFYPYRSASISTATCARPCGAATKIQDKRFLLQNVPQLPLRTCTNTNCTCTYDRHKDRRNSPQDRRAFFSLKTDLHVLGGDEEKREINGRRDHDRALFAASKADLSLTDESK